MLRKKLSQRDSLCGHAGHCSYPRQIFIHPKCERKRNVLFTRATTGSVLALFQFAECVKFDFDLCRLSLCGGKRHAVNVISKRGHDY